jgi:hypothetical protein
VNSLNSYTGKIIEVELTSRKSITGKLIEVGSDIIVLYNGKHYVYFPVQHIISVKNGESTDNEFINTDSSPIEKDGNLMSLKRILTNSSGIFVEIYLSGNHTVYGYITHIQEDYVVFESPAIKTIYIPIVHIKWLIPYLNQTPYQISSNQPRVISKESFAHIFEDQLKTFIGKIVIFDLGKDPQKVGKLINAEKNMVELITGDGQILYLNIAHIKLLVK